MTDNGVRRRSLLVAGAMIAAMAVTTTAAEAGSVIPPGDYQQVSLASGAAELGEPMSLAVLPNRSVVHTARDGTVRVTDAAGNTKTAGKLNVYTHDEEGLQGVAADPGFATNRYLWLYYSPRLSTPDGDAPTEGTQTDWDRWKGELNLSRFTLNADDTLNLASEKIVLRVPNDRGQCCHVGGDIDFDAAGNLYLTTGDDTNPFQSDSYSPIDERTNRNPQFDAQRSSANTNDLRGKVLRIRPQPEGTYTIPSGNLFPPGTAQTRPEIYAMGFRNPFRMNVDKATGIVYLGDYGPDAGATNPNRGPQGQVEFNRITAPGNYGWPYCTGTNTTTETYNEFTFPSGPSRAKYNCAGGPTNNSFRNTGQTTLPPAKPAWIRYGGDAGTPPEFGGGSESPMGGPIYRYDPNLNSTIKFPQSLDGRYFAGEYGRKWIKAIEVTGSGGVGDIGAFPWTGTQVMDMAFGPDGALYVLDYGTGANNAALWRIEYLGGTNRNPVAKAAGTPTSGQSPLNVTFSSAGSVRPRRRRADLPLDLRRRRHVHGRQPYAHLHRQRQLHGNAHGHRPDTGLTGTAGVQITVGNTAPTVDLQTPANGQLFSFGDTVPFQVERDRPRGRHDRLRASEGHLPARARPTTSTRSPHRTAAPARSRCRPTASTTRRRTSTACSTRSTPTTAGSPRTRSGSCSHGTGRASTSQPSKESSSPRHAGAEGGQTVGFTDNGDWISFTPYALGNVTSISARVSSAAPAGPSRSEPGPRPARCSARSR